MDMHTKAQMHVLERLARASPSQLLEKDSTGNRFLSDLYVECCNVKLTTNASATNDSGRLQVLFTVATEHGLPFLVTDYLQEICLDDTVTSSNLEEAYLSDGGCVSSWCEARVGEIEASISSGLEQFTRGASLPSACSSLNGLVQISEALLASTTAQASPQAVALLQKAIKLQQVNKVLGWIQRQEIFRMQPYCKHSSFQDWQSSVKSRRDRLGSNFFLDSLLGQIQGGPKDTSLSKAYPPQSLQKAVQSLFLADYDYKGTWNARLQLFLYLQLDAGNLQDVQSFVNAMGLSFQEAKLTQAHQLLDESLLETSSPVFKRACSILQDSAVKTIPFSIVRILQDLGQNEVAKQLLPKCQRDEQANSPNALQESLTIVKSLLSNNQLSEAYFEVKRYGRALKHGQSSTEEVERDLGVLVSCLASWAASSRQMGRLVALPFDVIEEKVLLGWLEKRIMAGESSGDACVLYHLQRRRLSEAVETYSRLKPPQGGDPGAENFRYQLSVLVAEAKAMLPEAQKCLKIQPGDAHSSISVVESAQGAQLRVTRTESGVVPLLNSIVRTAADEEASTVIDQDPPNDVPMYQASRNNAQMLFA